VKLWKQWPNSRRRNRTRMLTLFVRISWLCRVIVFFGLLYTLVRISCYCNFLVDGAYLYKARRLYIYWTESFSIVVLLWVPTFNQSIVNHNTIITSESEMPETMPKCSCPVCCISNSFDIISNVPWREKRHKGGHACLVFSLQRVETKMSSAQFWASWRCRSMYGQLCCQWSRFFTPRGTEKNSRSTVYS